MSDKARDRDITVNRRAFHDFHFDERIEGGDTLKVRYLDCIDGTKLLDIKPYLKSTDCEAGSSMGWLESSNSGRGMVAMTIS